MKAIDRLPTIRGTLEYRVRRASGEVVEHVVGENLVVDNAKVVIANLLGGAADKEIAKFGVGTDGTDPVAGDTSITGGVLVIIDSVSYPAAGQVAFAWSITRAQANGTSIREFGLFTSENELVARKTRAEPIEKTDEISLQGIWTLYF